MINPTEQKLFKLGEQRDGQRDRLANMEDYLKYENTKLREQLADAIRHERETVEIAEKNYQRAEAAEAKLRAASEQEPVCFGLYDKDGEFQDIAHTEEGAEDHLAAYATYSSYLPLYAEQVPPVDVQEPLTKQEILELAESCGAVITGKPDGSEAISILFPLAAWQKFANQKFYATPIPPADVQELQRQIDELRHENHNLNWALGAEGYPRMATEEEQAEADAAYEASLNVLGKMKERKSQFDAMKEHIAELERKLAEHVFIAQEAKETAEMAVGQMKRAQMQLAKAREEGRKETKESIATFVENLTYIKGCGYVEADKRMWIAQLIRRIDFSKKKEGEASE